MAVKLGLDAKLYRNTGTFASPAWNEITNVKDVTLNLEASEADVTTRGNAGWRATVAALLWRVYPPKDVQRATTPRGLLEFAAHPGTYEVELLVIRSVGDGLQVDEARVTVEIEPCRPVPPQPPAPPKPEPKPPEGGKLDPVNALGRIRFGNAGCTATVIGHHTSSGHWDVLTAAHCVSGVGARGTLTLKDGRSFGLRVVAYHKTPDVAWCVTDDEIADLSYALIAETNPAVDTPVWHMGFGVDKPGNREDGTVAERENAQGQLRMILSVSSGDSGGGIFRSDTNELVSVVCCTSGMARKVSMWGCSAEVARRTRSRPNDPCQLPTTSSRRSCPSGSQPPKADASWKTSVARFWRATRSRRFLLQVC